MIPIKTKKEVKIMSQAGRFLAQVMAEVIAKTRPGVKTKELDQLAERLIIAQKARPSFQMVPGYSWASCINVNDGLVHGVPGNDCLQVGDVVTIDLGLYYRGFHVDMARTFYLGREKEKKKPRGSQATHFLTTGEEALRKAIAAAQIGHRVGHISRAIQKTIEAAGYHCSRKFTGHGIGKKLHEEPRIACVLESKIEATPSLKKGMVLAIEVIYSQGRPEVTIDSDGWTARTVDGQLGGLFEDTVLITKPGPQVLTVV